MTSVQAAPAAANHSAAGRPSSSSSSSSSLPHHAQAASRAALSAALADPASAPPAAATTSNPAQTTEDGEIDSAASAPAEDGEGEEEQELTLPDAETVAEEIKTVFNDPMAFNVKHPLYSTWTLWFDSPTAKGRNLPPTPATPGVPATPITSAAAQGWMEDIKKVISFDSVEEFWGLYNNIIPPSMLPSKANYYLFKDGIMPAWEDEANKNGGKWSIQLPKEKNRGNVDKMWLYTMLAAIGETFDPLLTNPAYADPNATSPPQSLIAGVIVSSRPQFYRLSIWTRLAPGHGGAEDDRLRDRIEAIGKHFKMAVLGYGESQKLGGPLATEVEFLSHKDSEKKGRSQRKWVV